MKFAPVLDKIKAAAAAWAVVSGAALVVDVADLVDAVDAVQVSGAAAIPVAVGWAVRESRTILNAYTAVAKHLRRRSGSS